MNKATRDGLAWNIRARGSGVVNPSHRWTQASVSVEREGGGWGWGAEAGCLCLSSLGEGGLEVDEG